MPTRVLIRQKDVVWIKENFRNLTSVDLAEACISCKRITRKKSAGPLPIGI